MSTLTYQTLTMDVDSGDGSVSVTCHELEFLHIPVLELEWRSNWDALLFSALKHTCANSGRSLRKMCVSQKEGPPMKEFRVSIELQAEDGR